MNSGPTLCRHCDNVLEISRNSPPWRWQCMKFPRLDGFGYVTDEEWVNKPPYGYCQSINHGSCPLWEPRRGNEDATGTSNTPVR